MPNKIPYSKANNHDEQAMKKHASNFQVQQQSGQRVGNRWIRETARALAQAYTTDGLGANTSVYQVWAGISVLKRFSETSSLFLNITQVTKFSLET